MLTRSLTSIVKEFQKKEAGHGLCQHKALLPQAGMIRMNTRAASGGHPIEYPMPYLLSREESASSMLTYIITAAKQAPAAMARY